jgi:predicted SprT family Zn-dependent metalloprotease
MKQAKLQGCVYDEDVQFSVYACVCGEQFRSTRFMITAYNDKEHPVVCSKCGRKFYMVTTMKIYEVEPGP